MNKAFLQQCWQHCSHNWIIYNTAV